MVDLKPPRDIFTQTAPQTQDRFAARPLNESWPRPPANSNFNLQNTMSEEFGASVSKANLESPTTSDRLSGFAENAADKLGDAKDWMQSQTAGFLDAAEGDGTADGGWLGRLSSMLGGADIKKIGGSLSIVLGGYLGLVWLLRKVNPAGNQGIPTEVLEVVGNAPLDNRQNLQLVRLGSKLLLMIHGPDGTQPIGEVTDPAEVDHLVSLCNGRTRTANSAINRAVSRHQSNNQSGGMSLNLSANQQNNLTQLLSVLDQSNRGITARSYEA
ncbi:flagellar biosynthetic protein FliO [bacterium]|nr:flagellar biosynthetic protein FliO [bacterium]